MAGMSAGGGMSASGGAAGPSTATGGTTSLGGFTIGDYYGKGDSKHNSNTATIALAVAGVVGVVWLIARKK